MNKLMNELLVEEFEDLFKDVINEEEMNDKQRKAALRKLKSGKAFKALPSIFKEKETILAAGLSVDMVQNDIGKKYADAYKAFQKNTTEQAIFGSVEHKENIAAAKASLAVMKKYIGRVEKISTSLEKGSKKVASIAGKAKVAIANTERKGVMDKEATDKEATDKKTADDAIAKKEASKKAREDKKVAKAKMVLKEAFKAKVKSKLPKNMNLASFGKVK